MEINSMKNEIVATSVPNIPIHIGYSNRKYKGEISEVHFHDEIELLKVNAGKMLCKVYESRFEIAKGEVLFINSRIPHSTEAIQNNTSTVLLQISADAFLNKQTSKYLLKFINTCENPAVLFKSNNSKTYFLSEYIEEIKQEYLQKETAYDKYIKAGIYHILAFLHRNNAMVDVENYFDFKVLDKILPVLYHVEKNYKQPISLYNASKILNLNPQYFCRLFKKAMNCTFTEYLNFIRICNAEHLLLNTSNNVLDISMEVGFYSISYFNRTFKKYKGLSPTKYRKIKYAQK
jgi:YesN/AraC family two-component response regulator